MSSETMPSDNIDKDQLLRNVKCGYWSGIFTIYKEKKEVRTLEMSEEGDTLLHMAASRGALYAVKQMVNLICSEGSDEHDEISAADENGIEKKHVLGAVNNEGNTPLHVAASASDWSVEMCQQIGGADRSFIIRRNKAGETPLFLAAYHGNKEAFLWLHFQCPQDSSSRHPPYQRDDRDTILSCAMRQGHFDVAIEIVYLYREHLKYMMMTRDKRGLSLLHCLATNPSAFKSIELPTRFFIVQPLYHWCRVNKKKKHTTMEELKQRKPAVDALIDAVVEFNSNTNDIGSIWLLIVFPLRLLACVLVILLLFLKILLFISGEKCLRKWFDGIRKMKERHTWSVEILEILLQQLKVDNEDDSKIILQTEEYEGSKIVDSPLMIAAKNGVIEMVEKILDRFPDRFPGGIGVVNEEGKNIVLLAIEKRQTKLYQFLCGYKDNDYGAFRQVDIYGNTALHLTATSGINLKWQTTTMVEEFKWFEFVKSSVPSELFEKCNKDKKTAEKIFRASYKEHITSDRQWLNQTSQACSVASTLVASMAFSNFAGDNMDKKNNSSLVALSLSLTSTISFLGILAFRSQSLNFWKYGPFMLQLAILTMFGSIIALWISLTLHGQSITASVILGLPIAFLTIALLPIFIGRTLMSILRKVPPRSRKTARAIYYRRLTASTSAKSLLCFLHVRGRFVVSEAGDVSYVGGTVRSKTIKEGIGYEEFKLMISSMLGKESDTLVMKFTLTIDSVTFIDLVDDEGVQHLISLNDQSGHVYVDEETTKDVNTTVRDESNDEQILAMYM